ncbi:MAG: transglutaminase domain-containing protein [Ferruginibacter sp.]
MKQFNHPGFLLLACLFAGLQVTAQTKGRDFSEVDRYVASLGPLDSMSMGSISSTLTEKFPDKIDKAHAIYYWITHNINFDVKAARASYMDETYSPAKVLKSRKTVSTGFASLFQDMCSSADIRCLTVDGFVRLNTEQIGERAPEKNHSWDVVQLGQSPDTWYYVDPTLGSGYPDAEMKNFTKQYNEGYFFTDKELFNLQHFPDNMAWHLGGGTRNRKEFFEFPLLYGFAFQAGLKSFSPKAGAIKTALNKTISFSYKFPPDAPVARITVITGEKKKLKSKDVNFSYSGGALSFDYKIEQEGDYPLRILIDDKEFMEYIVTTD